MNSKMARLVIALVLVIGTFGVSAVPVQAGAPYREENYLNNVWQFPGVCSFPITVYSSAYQRITGYFDDEGHLIHFAFLYKEANTFEANGKTLTGMPVTYTLHGKFDENGNLISFTSTGGSFKTRLPSGKLFNASGLIDWMDHMDSGAIISVDRGNPGDIEALCAALAP